MTSASPLPRCTNDMYSTLAFSSSPAASAAEARSLDRALRASPEQPVTPTITKKQAPKAKERRKEEIITENRVK